MTTESVPEVAPRLRELRRVTGLTLEAAASRVGLSPAHLSRLETGQRQPSLPMLLAPRPVASAEPAREQARPAGQGTTEARPIRVILPAPWEPARTQADAPSSK